MESLPVEDPTRLVIQDKPEVCPPTFEKVVLEAEHMEHTQEVQEEPKGEEETKEEAVMKEPLLEPERKKPITLHPYCSICANPPPVEDKLIFKAACGHVYCVPCINKFHLVSTKLLKKDILECISCGNTMEYEQRELTKEDYAKFKPEQKKIEKPQEAAEDLDEADVQDYGEEWPSQGGIMNQGRFQQPLFNGFNQRQIGAYQQPQYIPPPQYFPQQMFQQQPFSGFGNQPPIQPALAPPTQGPIDEDDEVFICPFDKIKFNHQGMVDHIIKYHKKQTAVCPICEVRGGDPNYVSQNLVGHIELNHVQEDMYCPNEWYFDFLFQKKMDYQQKVLQRAAKK